MSASIDISLRGTPDEVAARIVRTYLDDLSKDRQVALLQAISEAMDEWGSLCAAVEFESGRDA